MLDENPYQPPRVVSVRAARATGVSAYKSLFIAWLPLWIGVGLIAAKAGIVVGDLMGRDWIGNVASILLAAALFPISVILIRLIARISKSW
jgi:hypothetical protein